MPHPLARAALAALALLPCVPRPGATQVIELTPFLALHAPTFSVPSQPDQMKYNFPLNSKCFTAFLLQIFCCRFFFR